MERPFTIYFDTNFYVWLAQSTQEEAVDVMSGLNLLGVRHVLSGRILLELLSGKERNPQDKNLFERVTKFKIPPYIIPIGLSSTGTEKPNLGWDSLCLDGEARAAFSSLLKEIFDAETAARSWSNIAGKKLNKDKEQKLGEKSEPFLKSIGFDKDQTDEKNANAFTTCASELVSGLASILPDEQREKLGAIDFTVEKTPENLSNLSSQLFASFDSPTLERLEEEARIVSSAVELDPRPFDVVTDNSSRREIKSLGNTFRDAEHLSVFVAHADQIDIIQIDSRQKNLIERNSPIHRLKVLKLTNRYFSVVKLQQVVQTVSNKKAELR